MTATELQRQLQAAGVEGASGGWRGVLLALGLRIAMAVAPQAMLLLQRLVVAGATTLLTRLEAALAPATTPDYALLIVRGIEHDHGDGAPLAAQWPGAQRAEFAAAAIRQWLLDAGAHPDDALVNQVVEDAVGRLRVAQAAALAAALPK